MPSGHSYLLNNQDIFQAQANETAQLKHVALQIYTSFDPLPSLHS